jgi:putative acetyltransferase
MDVKIRRERQGDYQRVYEINRLAFGRENESKLVNKIRKGENFIPDLSLVAEIGNEIAGYSLLSKINIVGGSIFESLALAPVAVVPEHQKKGIGGKLIRSGLDNAKGLGFVSVIVLGHPKYYPRFGFQRASIWGIKCPFEAPDEAFMAMELREGALKDKAGTVKYPKEFMDQ